ncbi:hypothetical protein FGE05_18130 [Pseudomonas sp. ICMP22404]|nr:hypothetical protein FGE05_18130 [Pseudomonas sp. ICMP22404]
MIPRSVNDDVLTRRQTTVSNSHSSRQELRSPAGLLALASVLGFGKGHFFLIEKTRRLMFGDFAKRESLFQSFPDELHVTSPPANAHLPSNIRKKLLPHRVERVDHDRLRRRLPFLGNPRQGYIDCGGKICRYCTETGPTLTSSDTCCPIV